MDIGRSDLSWVVPRQWWRSLLCFLLQVTQDLCDHRDLVFSALPVGDPNSSQRLLDLQLNEHASTRKCVFGSRCHSMEEPVEASATLLHWAVYGHQKQAGLRDLARRRLQGQVVCRVLLIPQLVLQTT